MTYRVMFNKAKRLMKGVDASSVKEHVAYQFNVEGDGEGIFYVEIAEDGFSL